MAGTALLPQAAAQGGGVVNPQPLIVNLDFTQTAVVEGDGGALANVELRLAFASAGGAARYDATHQLTVTFATQNGTATGGTCGVSGADFVPASGQVNFSGQASATINLQVCAPTS